MTLDISHLRKILIFIIFHTLCVTGAQSYPNTRTTDSGFLDSTNSSPTIHPQEKTMETQISVNVEITQSSTVDENFTDADEEASVIKTAIKEGIFPSKKDWEKEHGNCTDTSNLKNNNCGHTKKRRNNESHHEFPSSDQPHFSSQTDDRVYFPGDTNVKSTIYVPNPNACKGVTICENAPNYPEHIIREAIKRHNITYISTNDVLPVDRHVINIDQRIGVPFSSDSLEERQLCDTEIKVIQPRSGQNLQGEWRYIVNSVENITHNVIVELCRSENGSCNFIGGSVLGYEALCLQKYIYRDMQALTPDGNIKVQSFRIPASCCCGLHFDGKIMNRMRNKRVARGTK